MTGTTPDQEEGNMSAVEIPQFGWTPNKFILHNAAPKPVDIRWCGLQFTLPAVDQLGARAASFADGRVIPGTLVLSDAHCVTRDGEFPPPDSPPNWSAFEAIRNVLGINPITRQAESPHAQAGISFLPNSPSEDVFQAVKADGERRYQESLVAWANDVVHNQRVATEKAQQAGLAAPPAGSDYMKAITILERHRKTVEKDLNLGRLEEASGDDELEILAIAKAKAMEMAEKNAVGKSIDKNKLAEEYMQDPQIRQHLMNVGYRIRKKGHADVPDPAE
jgi:hypothetical protein